MKMAILGDAYDAFVSNSVLVKMMVSPIVALIQSFICQDG